MASPRSRRSSGPTDVIHPANDAHDFWLNHAHNDPAARALADRLNLCLPAGQPFGLQALLVYPIRRLVVAGEDSPENMRTLLGEKWELATRKRWEEVRAEVLVTPARRRSSSSEDDGEVEWNPRPPSEREIVKIAEVKQLRREFGVVTEEDEEDSLAILT